MENRRFETSTGSVPVNVVICDGCGWTMAADDAVNWIEVDSFGVETPTLGDRPTPLQACSVECARKALDRLSWTRKESRE